MKKKILLGLFIFGLFIIGITVVVMDENTLVYHPKGIIAQSILDLIITNYLLILSIILPTYVLLFVIVWKYCIKNEEAKHDPDHTYGLKGQVLMWVLPSIVVVVMSFVNWDATYDLNPYKPIESDDKPLSVQVVAMDWKWLFIYPELGIATLNFLHIPERTAIHLKLTADHSPMNSFWIPQLSGQIYSMTGMTTQLYLMADAPGTYQGKAVEINGDGYADMTFTVKSSSQKEFDEWVNEVKKSNQHLTADQYKELVKHEINKSIILYSEVEPNLYHKIVEQYMYPTESLL